MTKRIVFIFIIFNTLAISICLSQNQNFHSDSLRAIELNRKGNDFGRQGFFSQSLKIHLENLSLRTKLYGVDSEKLGPALMGIGNAYKNLGQTDLALKYYKLAETNYGERITRSLLVNIGGLYRNKLDFILALSYYNQAIVLSLKDSLLSNQNIAGIYYNIADIYYITNQYNKALSICSQNVQQAYLEDQILFYELMASIYQVNGDISNAKMNFQKSIQITENIYGNLSNNLAISYLKYANFLTENDQYSEGRKMLFEANEIIQNGDFPNKITLSDYYKAEGYWIKNFPVATNDINLFKKQKAQNIETAIEWYLKSLDALNFKTDFKNFDISDAEKSISLKNSIELLKFIADAYFEIDELKNETTVTVVSDNLNKSLEIYQIAGKLIQKARIEITNEESKIELTNLESETFNQIIKIAYKAYSLKKERKYFELAFQNAEKLKSSSLFDKISGQLALENSLVPDSVTLKESQINSSITYYNEKLLEEKSKSLPDSTIIKEYNNEIFSLSRQRDELNRLIETEYRDYYELKYSNNQLTINEIQHKIKPEQTLLEYHINQNDSLIELYTFIITKTETNIRKQELSTAFQKSVDQLFQFMSNSDFLFTTGEDSKKYCSSAWYLYNTLLKPHEVLSKNSKITIIPDGLISYVPFDALLKTLPDTSKNIEFNQLDYLIRKYTFNYANSINLLFQKQKTKNRHSVKAIAFAPEYKIGEVIEYAGQKITLVPLAGTQKEVSRISRLVNTTVYTGLEATEENFRKDAEKYDILHLAMHAFINDSLPAFSSLAFAQTDSSDVLNNGLLNTSDIYNLKLQAALTVLSACNTGMGKLRKGEGIMSLARGFLYAGCPSIIMSLWEVEDNSGTEIISSFYKNLKRGKAKDEALRMAKLEYLENANSRMAHPHYWLGFVSIGDESPIYKSYDFYFFIVLILALTGVGIDQIIRIKKARRKRAS
jgi:CHAT domain-containing protein